MQNLNSINNIPFFLNCADFCEAYQYIFVLWPVCIVGYQSRLFCPIKRVISLVPPITLTSTSSPLHCSLILWTQLNIICFCALVQFTHCIGGGAHFVRCKNIVWLIHGHPKVKHKQHSGHEDSDDDCTGDRDARVVKTFNRTQPKRKRNQRTYLALYNQNLDEAKTKHRWNIDRT